MKEARTYDVAIIGGGVFGAWTALTLVRESLRVVLIEQYGPANARASSGGESRIIRMGYGPDELYTRWSLHSLPLWQELFRSTGQRLFHRTGVLWLAREAEQRSRETLATLGRCGAEFQLLSRPELEVGYPQIALADIAWGILEPASGVLMARRAVQAAIQKAIELGLAYRIGQVLPPEGRGLLPAVQLADGGSISAATYVFACGPWLGKLFPNLLGERIFPSRQEVFFFGVPPGDVRFSSPALPTWISLGDEMYGMPDVESRGVKIACDRHGPAFDPDAGSRIPTKEGIEEVRAFVARRFPALAAAPVLESRVCQYENTSNGDFLIDRHPELENIWLVGGGSGHGFKHGPALGEHVASLVTATAQAEPRFSLASKERVRHRSVF